MIYVNGLYRSGTTVLYNLMKELGPVIGDKGLNKIHESWLNIGYSSNNSCVYSYRDLRYLTASLMRMTGSDENNFFSAIGVRGMKARNMNQWFEFLVEWDRRVKERQADYKILVLRYETDIIAFENGISKILDFYNIKTDNAAKHLAEKYSIQNSYDFSVKLHKHDQISQYHQNHISLEKTDFRDYLSEESLDNAVLNDWLVENGYEK